MKRNALFVLLVLALAAAPACRTNSPGGGSSHGDDAHSHGEPAGVSVTRWTDRTELFMEHPSLVAGAKARAAVHVTDLVGFSPVDRGETTVTLRSAEGRVLQFRGGPSSPGIFGVDLLPDRAGVYDMTLKIDANEFVDVHELGPVTVHAEGDATGTATADEGEIAFLKEQQWALEFGTVAAEPRSLRSGITVPATVQPRAGGQADLTAPVPGRIGGGTVPVPGARVRAGAVVASIVPRPDDLRDAAAMRAALVEAEQAHGLAVRERERVERLVEGRALPARRLDEAEAALKAAEARHLAAQQRWSRYESLGQTAHEGGAVLDVRAPFDGVVSEVRFSPGAGVEEGQVLLRIVDPDRVHVVGAVPESAAAGLGTVEGGELLLRDRTPIRLERPLSVGRFVEPVARTTEVRFAFDNAPRLPVGKSVGLRLFVGEEVEGTAVPESAIVDDAGRPVVFVQVDGESFSRRPVQLGTRAEGWVHVLDGVETGERVVHVGAYLVRLAAMSSQIPSHGHVH